jgi:hypothetical protein
MAQESFEFIGIPIIVVFESLRHYRRDISRLLASIKGRSNRFSMPSCG